MVSPLLGVERRDPLLTSSRRHTGGRRFPALTTQYIQSGLQPPLTMSQVVLSLDHLPYFFQWSDVPGCHGDPACGRVHGEVGPQEGQPLLATHARRHVIALHGLSQRETERHSCGYTYIW